MDLILELGLLFAVCLLGQWGAELLPIPVPGSVVSLLLLLVLLLSGRVRQERFERSGDFFLGNMGIFFVPALVGILEHLALLRSVALPFLAVTLLTTPIVYCAAAWTTQLLMKRQRRKEGPHA